MTATIASLIFIHCDPLLNQSTNISTSDFTYQLWPIALCNQVVQAMGIVVSCIPYIKPFLESLESGMIRTDDLRRLRVTGVYGYHGPSKRSGRTKSYKLGDIISSASKTTPTQRMTGAAGAENIDGIVSEGRNFATATAILPGGSEERDWDAESQRSSSRIIKQTRTWNGER